MARQAGRAEERPHLLALDGLRFVAAFFVMAAHGYWYLISFQATDNIDALAHAVRTLAAYGMTLFFVLSGFVIHLNYRESIRQPGGLWRFFVGRFSRLYPLFLAVFVIELWRIYLGRSSGVYPPRGLLMPAPFFLTFTQTWWPFPIDGVYAAGVYGGGTGAMWSLSTEAFFYVSYPLLAPLLARLRGRSLAIYLALVSVALVVLSFAAYDFRAAINSWAIWHFGRQSSPFYGWLTFDSPWFRIFEFLIGAGAAQAFCTCKTPRGIAFLGVLAIAGIVYLTFGIPVHGLSNTALAPLFAFAVYSVAAAPSKLSSALSSRFMVWGGGASYSLYLLHFYVLHEWGVTLVRADTPFFDRLAIYFALMGIALVVARLCYVCFERPAMLILRSVMDPSRARPSIPATAVTL